MLTGRATLMGTVVLAGCATPTGQPGSDSSEHTRPVQSNGRHASENQLVTFYVSKLPDRRYANTYGDADNPRPWYTAAEALGDIGMPAIPALIARLETPDQYELKLVLYALMLASQDPDLRSGIGGDYLKLDTVLAEDDNQENRQRALDWWQRYQHLFSDSCRHC